MTPQLAALFAAHKTAILGGGAAAVAGLALLQKRKSAGTGTATTAGARVAGTSPAAAVVGSTGGGYDSSVTDLYNALQPELEALRQTSGGGITAAPAPVASTLLAPTGGGQLVRYGTDIGEVESDGSVYKLTLPEWSALGAPSYVQLGDAAAAPKTYTKAGNLAAKISSAPKA